VFTTSYFEYDEKVVDDYFKPPVVPLNHVKHSPDKAKVSIKANIMNVIFLF